MYLWERACDRVSARACVLHALVGEVDFTRVLFQEQRRRPLGLRGPPPGLCCPQVSRPGGASARVACHSARARTSALFAVSGPVRFVLPSSGQLNLGPTQSAQFRSNDALRFGL